VDGPNESDENDDLDRPIQTVGFDDPNGPNDPNGPDNPNGPEDSYGADYPDDPDDPDEPDSLKGLVRVVWPI